MSLADRLRRDKRAVQVQGRTPIRFEMNLEDWSEVLREVCAAGVTFDASAKVLWSLPVRLVPGRRGPTVVSVDGMFS